MDVSRDQAKRFVQVLAANTNEHAYTFLAAILGSLPSGEFSHDGDYEHRKREQLAELLRGIADHLIESDYVSRARVLCQIRRTSGTGLSASTQAEIPEVIKAEFPDLFPSAEAKSEPTEEEVLASIRRIISEDDDAVEAAGAEAAPRPKPRPRKKSA